jgi:hypothetical protein
MGDRPAHDGEVVFDDLLQLLVGRAPLRRIRERDQGIQILQGFCLGLPEGRLVDGHFLEALFDDQVLLLDRRLVHMGLDVQGHAASGRMHVDDLLGFLGERIET